MLLKADAVVDVLSECFDKGLIEQSKFAIR
jgi:hypothetical protein